MSLRSDSKRFLALDLLRGFFIVVIIIDHLSRWPSMLSIFTGKALLWVTAAEGFVIISGLLIGYVRGFKSKTESLRSVTFKIWRRSLLLYAWAILGSIVYTSLIWYVPLAGGAPGMPIEKGDWPRLVFESINLTYTFVWVYFLKLYAIFLAFSPLAIWLLRQGKGWLVGMLSFALLILGWIFGDEVLQWQFVFFVPMIVGYYLPSIQAWWHGMTRSQRHMLSSTVIITTVATIVLSAISTFLPDVSSTLDRASTSAFAKDSMSLLRALTAFIWFAGYFFVFLHLQKHIWHWLGWLLFTIGTHSLTAYILHGGIIILISYFIAASENIVTNTLLGILAVVSVWALLKVPGINKVVPR